MINVPLLITLIFGLATVNLLAAPLPEDIDETCREYSGESKSRCNEVYRLAEKGNLDSYISIGVSIIDVRPKQRSPESSTWLVEFEKTIAKYARGARWFRPAYEMGSAEAAYWLAKTMHDAFLSAIIALASGEDGGALLTAALAIGPLPEAAIAAKSCAEALDARCMELLGDFHATGYGFGMRISRLNAAEWYFKASVRYFDLGNREQALVLFEKLQREYSDYPYATELKNYLYPRVEPQPPNPPTYDNETDV